MPNRDADQHHRDRIEHFAEHPVVTPRRSKTLGSTSQEPLPSASRLFDACRAFRHMLTETSLTHFAPPLSLPVERSLVCVASGGASSAPVWLFLRRTSSHHHRHRRASLTRPFPQVLTGAHLRSVHVRPDAHAGEAHGVREHHSAADALVKRRRVTICRTAAQKKAPGRHGRGLRWCFLGETVHKGDCERRSQSRMTASGGSCLCATRIDPFASTV